MKWPAPVLWPGCAGTAAAPGRFLEAAGASAAASFLRTRAQRLLVLSRSAPALPAGARVVPQDYGIRSEHPPGFVLLAAWEFREAV